MGRKRTREATDVAAPIIAEESQQSVNVLAAAPISESARYPLLESLLALRGLALKAIYTVRDVAQIFGTSARTIQDWVASRKLRARLLPGRGRFLSQDLEDFLQRSVKEIR